MFDLANFIFRTIHSIKCYDFDGKECGPNDLEVDSIVLTFNDGSILTICGSWDEGIIIQ